MAEKNAFHIHQMPAHPDDGFGHGATEERLLQLQCLEANWDSYDGLPPSEAAIREARRILHGVESSLGIAHGRDTSPVVIAPTSNGGVLLEWTTKQTDLEVEISNAGRLSYLKTRRNAGGEQYDERDDSTVQEIVGLVSSTIDS